MIDSMGKGLTYTLLEMIAANGGAFENRRRIQKSAYLLKQIGASGFERADFKYDLYGPTSRQVSDALHEIVIDGLVEETREPVDAEYYKYSYLLTQKGKARLDMLTPAGENCFSCVLERFKEFSESALQLATMVIFLSREGGIKSEAEAFDFVLEVHPELNPERRAARTVIRYVRIIRYVTRNRKRIDLEHGARPALVGV